MDYNNNPHHQQQQFSQKQSSAPAGGDYLGGYHGNNTGSFVAADPGSVAPIVPVAAAPKCETLYDSLLKYHNENDSTSTEDSGARRRRNPKVTPYEAARLKRNNSRSDEESSMGDDQKLPAQPVTLKQPPPASAAPPPSMTAVVKKKPPPPSGLGTTNSGPKAPPKPAPKTPPRGVPGGGIPIEEDKGNMMLPKQQNPGRGSFYQAALEAAGGGGSLAKPISPVPAKMPGIVHVAEPGMRPNSAMYQAAYGNSAAQQQQQSSNSFPEPLGVLDVREKLASLKQQRTLEAKRQMLNLSGGGGEYDKHLQPPPAPGYGGSPPSINPNNMGLSQSNHAQQTQRNRSSDGGSLPTELLRKSSGPSTSSSSSSKPAPDHMMNIGNDSHIGLPSAPNQNKARTSKSPKRVPSIPSTFFGKRPSSDTQPPRFASHDESMLGRNRSDPNAWLDNPMDPLLRGGGMGPSSMQLTSAGPSYGSNHSSSANSGQNRSLNSSLNSSTHSAMTPGEFNRINTNRGATGGGVVGGYQSNGIPNYGYNNNSNQMGGGYGMQGSRPPFMPEDPSIAEQSHSTADSSMDDELRLALEISKQDTGVSMGSVYPSTSQRGYDSGFHNAVSSSRGPPPTMASRPNQQAYTKQSSFTRDALAQARDGSNSSLADLMLALKLSAEESGMSSGAAGQLDRRTSTNLDELLAFEFAQNSNQNMTDFVAAGMFTAGPAPGSRSSGSDNPDEQYRILEKIREEQEQRELEMALKASEQEVKQQTKPGAVEMHQPASYLYSQEKAMEDWARPGFMHNQHHPTMAHGNTKPRPRTQRENSLSSIDSDTRRRELLERGTSETRQAIQAGQAHVVICRGCQGRLQAPVSYSLVFCPKCQTISPA